MSTENVTSKLVYLLTPDQANGARKEVYKLGRGNDQDVRITDISVSRSHARICFDGHKFMIEDESSKFGTLV